jgi:uncharacterized protein YukE
MSIDEKDADWRRERDPATFTVVGGSAFRADTAALAAAADDLAAASRAADAACSRLESARSAVWRGACAGSGTASRFDADASGLVRGAAGLGLDLAASSRAVDAAAAAYAETEAGRAADVQGLQGLARVLVWGTAPPLVPWEAIGFARGRFAAAGLGAVLAGASGAVAAGVLGGPGRLISPWLPAGGGSDPIAVAKAKAVRGQGDPGSFAYAAESLRQAQGNAPLEDGSTVPPSSIMVERVARGDGTTAVVVTVPGTQSWHPDDPSGGIFDGEGNLQGLASRDSHARQLIEHALADQHLALGDVVVFNTYSQGSIHVFGLLESEDFRLRYPVAAVTVLGGLPTAFTVPDDVPVLSVRQDDDVVPGLSGMAPAPLPHVVDVRTPAHRDRPLSSGPLELVGTSHALDRYALDAQALDRSADPSVLGYAAVLGAAVGATAASPPAGPGRGAGHAPRERFIYTGADTRTPASGAGGKTPPTLTQGDGTPAKGAR